MTFTKAQLQLLSWSLARSIQSYQADIDSCPDPTRADFQADLEALKASKAACELLLRKINKKLD